MCMFVLFVQEDLENFGDVGSPEYNVESFLSHDGGDGNIYGSLKQTLTEHKTETSKGGLYDVYACFHLLLNATSIVTKVIFHALCSFYRFFIWRGWLYTNKK